MLQIERRKYQPLPRAPLTHQPTAQRLQVALAQLLRLAIRRGNETRSGAGTSPVLINIRRSSMCC